MKLLKYISILAIVAAGLHADPEGPTINTQKNLPVQDLLNMKGVDRESPLSRVSIEQRLDTQLPLDATFRDETGQARPLGAFFGKRPVVLALVY